LVKFAQVERHADGNTMSAANHVRKRADRVEGSDVDRSRDLDLVIDLNVEPPRKVPSPWE
jgi:hypothetical protein